MAYLNNKKIWLVIASSLIAILLVIYFLYLLKLSPVNIVSLASSGDYAVSSHHNGEIILWDVKAQKSRLIAKDSNKESAYFIKKGNNFLWQDMQANRVHIQNTTGEGVFSFHLDYPVRNVIMTTDLERLYTCDIHANLYAHQDGKSTILKKGRFLEVALSNNDKFLLISGFDGVMLWNEKELVRQFSGLVGKVVAAISPDNKYVVAGDEQGTSIVWDVVSEKVLFKNQQNKAILTIKFIDLAGHYLCFNKDGAAVLYNINAPALKKNVYFGKKYNQEIDTAPQAQTLVLSRAKTARVVFFHFDSKKQNFNKIWDTKLAWLMSYLF